MAEILEFTGETYLDIPVDCVLDGIAGSDLGSMVAMGYDRSGRLHLFSSTGDAGRILIMLEKAKKLLLDQDD